MTRTRAELAAAREKAVAIITADPSTQTQIIMAETGLSSSFIRTLKRSYDPNRTSPDPDVARRIARAREIRLAEPRLSLKAIGEREDVRLPKWKLEQYLRDLAMPGEIRREIRRETMKKVRSDPFAKAKCYMGLRAAMRSQDVRRKLRKAGRRDRKRRVADLNSPRAKANHKAAMERLAERRMAWCPPAYRYLYKEVRPQMGVRLAQEYIKTIAGRAGIEVKLPKAPPPREPKRGKTAANHDPARAYDMVQNQEMRVMDVADALGTSSCTISASIRRYAKRHGLPLRDLRAASSGRPRTIDFAHIYDLFQNQGMRVVDIAERLGCSAAHVSHTLGRYAQENGLPLRGRQERKVFDVERKRDHPAGAGLGQDAHHAQR